jgi:UDP-N-acetylglucosamine diphosphorylase / glucose-1-phosphate thymidylyltransferase / UDP-N-acetylgalactosamine diphosphorylase / glucosamine-1-phosphate N-acetyltransferase / galactosamine-1-phosphate N-acetyltransferase
VLSILVYEDALVEQLAPITTARPACAVTVASYNLLDILDMTAEPLVGWLREFLRDLQRADHPRLGVHDDLALRDTPGPQLAINARVVPGAATLDTIRRLLADPAAPGGIVWDGKQIAAVVNPGWSWEQIAGSSGIESLLLSAGHLPRLDATLQLLSYPHEVIAANMAQFQDNAQLRIASGAYTQQHDGVFLADGARLGQYVLCETSTGPIIIDREAQVGPYTLLRGPLYIGPRAKILEHAAIKDAVSLGHTTKVGGEVEAAVVEPFSNKQHHGFLGHSYLGSWINLGAGTCNSDLKNTYGAVNMEYASGKAATGMQFLGCIMGDYSKTAINTGIFTGKVIGVCSMMYGFVTSNVPSFVNYARLFGQMTTLPPDIMTATQLRMFSRRKVQQRACDTQLIHDMYRMTQHERDRFGDALSF